MGNIYIFVLNSSTQIRYRTIQDTKIMGVVKWNGFLATTSTLFETIAGHLPRINSASPDAVCLHI